VGGWQKGGFVEVPRAATSSFKARGVEKKKKKKSISSAKTNFQPFFFFYIHTINTLQPLLFFYFQR
jgi:hypothetical protein